MDKDTRIRMIITVVLCTVLFVGWQFIFMPKKQVTVADNSSEPIQAPTVAADSADSIVVPVDTPVDIPVSGTPLVYMPPFTVDTSDFSIGFDTDSGDIRFVSLSAYKDNANEAPVFIRSDNEGSNYASFTAGISSGYTHAVERQPEGTVVTFTAENDILRIVKQYLLPDKGYHIPMVLSAENLSGDIRAVPVNVTVGPDLGKGFGADSYVFVGPIIHNKGGTEKKKAKDVKKTLALSEPLWGGYTSKYFIFAVFAGGFNYADITKSGNSAVTAFHGTMNIAPGATNSVNDLALYVGAKEYETLKAFGIDLQKSIDYGWFFFLAIPMTKIMNFAYGFVHNYGIAIIILTIIVKVITLPLTLKSMISMRAMSKLQPEMVKIREQYKGDPQKMNAATMDLYKKHKVNPMSGCLPMIVQLPIFFALYKSLLVSIELKGAPFFAWIVDLSAKDPYYITPILMGASMFLQQKMTPATADPMQRKIFLMMPVIFTFLFLSFPSGLVVYWLTNNILSIAQQYVINKRVK